MEIEASAGPTAKFRQQRASPTARYRAKRDEQAAAQPNYAVGLGRAIGQGATFGYADEAEAGMRALIDQNEGEDYTTAYTRIRDGVRGSNQAFGEANPVTSTVAEIAGAVGAALVPGLGTAGAAGRFIGGGATLAGRAGRTAVVGAAQGGLYGAGTANEIEDIPGSAAQGAVLGGALGGAVPVALKGGQAVWNTIRNKAKPELGAAARLAQAFERDGVTVDTVRRNLRAEAAAGRPATIADSAGKNVKMELDRVAQSPGAGSNAAEEFYSSRNRDQLRRISESMVSMAQVGTKNSDDVAATIATTMEQRSRAAKPLYDKAWQFQAELNDGIVQAYDTLIKSPAGQSAMKSAKKILNVEDFDGQPMMLRIQAVKEAIDDDIGALLRKGRNKQAGKLIELKNNLLANVDNANPSYAQAREVWSNGETYLKSVQSGRDLAKNATTATQVKQTYAKLSAVDREAFRMGVVDEIITQMRSNSAKEPNLINKLRSPEMRDKLTAVMTPKQARRFEKMIAGEDRMFEVGAGALRGSQTAGRTAVREEAERQSRGFEALWSVLELMTHGARNLAIQTATWLPRKIRDNFMARQNEILAGKLISRDPAILRMLQQNPPITTGGAASNPTVQAATVAGTAPVADVQ